MVVLAALFTGVAADLTVLAGFEAGAIVFLTGVFDTVLAGVVVVFAAGVTVFFGVTVLAGVVVGFDTELTAALVAGAFLTGVAAGLEIVLAGAFVVVVGVVFLTGVAAGFDAVTGFAAAVVLVAAGVPAAFNFRGTRFAAVVVAGAAPVVLSAGLAFAAAAMFFAAGFLAGWGWVPATLDTLLRLAACVCQPNEPSCIGICSTHTEAQRFGS